jgi:hypothetical protein
LNPAVKSRFKRSVWLLQPLFIRFGEQRFKFLALCTRRFNVGFMPSRRLPAMLTDTVLRTLYPKMRKLASPLSKVDRRKLKTVGHEGSCPSWVGSANGAPAAPI